MQLQADKLIRMALEEDITSEDVSTNAVMPTKVQGTVDLIAKEDGVIAGMDVYARVFKLLDEDTEIEMFCHDGDEVREGDLMAKVTGDIRVLLSGERVALNYLQRMSGIATYTRSVAKLLEGSGVTLLDTRKTTPNCRVFEKYAVRVGGGCNHRYNLSDGVLLKDNHIGAAGSITKAIQMAKAYTYKIHPRAGRKGVVSVVLSGITIILFLGLLTACTALKGKAGLWAGAVGFSGMMAALAGVITGLRSFRDRQPSYGFSKTGTIINGIMVAVWFILFCRGLAA